MEDRRDGVGTGLVADIQPGPGNSTPSVRIALDELEFFWANDGVSGNELWRSDGTPAGTVRMKDIRPGPTAPSRTAGSP